ncbi:MAG: tetratricopeptide repeat protein [Variovorax sp.]|uniref:Uncharacterized protein n=1 Tax=Variovorax paradoxus TaxID=34073 RepID=A0A2W5S1X1_VARPD|nr:tetratricopeptide repeat protein [Variovorax sp.]PZQ76747.1 MAG: hypothetical protein DI563_06180 [Variovorax paradoxus]
MRKWLLAAAFSAAAWIAHADPRVPVSDDTVVESLPVVAGWSSVQREMRRQLTQKQSDPAAAVKAANSYLDLARDQGDARYAGYAMGALQAWQDVPESQTPAQVLVMRATVAQFLHDFERAESNLRAALAREPHDAQAWITLATVLRVRGRLAESEAACRSLGRAGPALYAIACIAENQALRGQYDEARSAFDELLAAPTLAHPSRADTRQWLLTSLAELEELAGRPAQADAAYRKAVATQRSGYLLLSYSDFLQRTGRHAEVPALLAQEPRSDAVLLRMAIASTGEPRETYAKELAQRFDAAALRPGTAALHAREEAMFALDVQGDRRRALELARLNVRLQREPIDFLLYARAAVAAGDGAARADVVAQMNALGLKDSRVNEVLR